MTEQELQLLLKEGEGYRIEFKEALSGLDKEITAFANAGLKSIRYEFSNFVRLVFSRFPLTEQTVNTRKGTKNLNEKILEELEKDKTLTAENYLKK